MEWSKGELQEILEEIQARKTRAQKTANSLMVSEEPTVISRA
jgi:hypothetical protein